MHVLRYLILMKSIAFKICEHKYMNMRPFIIDLPTAVVAYSYDLHKGVAGHRKWKNYIRGQIVINKWILKTIFKNNFKEKYSILKRFFQLRLRLQLQNLLAILIIPVWETGSHYKILLQYHQPRRGFKFLSRGYEASI